MKTYCCNGIVKEVPYIIENFEEFQIQEMVGSKPINRFSYPGDAINYTLDEKLVSLYDTFRDMIFDDTNQYYSELNILPIWCQGAGQNSDCSVSAELFGEWISKNSIPNLYKHLYLVDCQFLVGTVQNLLCAIEDAFINYYRAIANFEMEPRYTDLMNPNGTIRVLSGNATRVAAIIETYFTKAYSILDIICKICYEIQFIQKDFSKYKKTKSADVLWGTRKKLTINGTENTLFEHCDFIKTIEAIRNEIVHNGTWELNPKIFIRFENGKVRERFMLFPDMVQGHLATVRGRKHFFSSGKKVNDILPKIHLEFKQRLLNTIELINHESVRQSK